MTSEQRLDRLERIVNLMIRAGMRGRTHMRQLDQKIEILIDSQIRHDELFRLNEVKLKEKFLENEIRFAKLAQSQARADRTLERFIRAVEKGRN